MRLYLVASALGLGLITLTPVAADTAPAATGAPARTKAPLLAAAPAAPPAPSSAPADAADAAVKHAKRTACLKEAKEKKRVGEDKKTYVKNCLGST